MRALLLNPGPVSLSPGVRSAATAVDLCHREPEYFDLQDSVRRMLLQVYELGAEEWTPVLLGGSGTAAMEAMMVSLLAEDSNVLILENGVYGERFRRLAVIHGLQHSALAFDWLQAWNLHEIRSTLVEENFTHVAAVHHETTTGRLNPVGPLAELCEQAGATLLLDTVSSFGAEAIPFDSPALGACALTANKCLHGIPGLCVVMVRNPALAACVQPPRSLTLNLALWAEHQQQRSTPFTPPVNALLALEQALRELRGGGGWPSRHARYHRMAEKVCRSLAGRNVAGLIPEDESSCVLRSYRLPKGSSYAQVHDALKLRGFVVYAGQGQFADGIFRISTMGDIGDYDVDRLLTALGEVFC